MKSSIIKINSYEELFNEVMEGDLINFVYNISGKEESIRFLFKNPEDMSIDGWFQGKLKKNMTDIDRENANVKLLKMNAINFAKDGEVLIERRLDFFDFNKTLYEVSYEGTLCFDLFFEKHKGETYTLLLKTDNDEIKNTLFEIATGENGIYLRTAKNSGSVVNDLLHISLIQKLTDMVDEKKAKFDGIADFLNSFNSIAKEMGFTTTEYVRIDEEPSNDGNYSPLQECIKNKTHLTSCDNDGYCNFCGQQDEEAE